MFVQALAKDPADRYGSAGEFVAALRAALADAAGSTSRLAAVPPPPAPTAATAPMGRDRDGAAWARRSGARRTAWPLLTALLVAGAIAGALLAYALTRDDSSGQGGPTVITRDRTVTQEGRVTTIERPVTVTTSPPATQPASPPASGQSGTALNDQGFAKMQAGDYAGALPLLEQAVEKLQGTGSLAEAYASYNLAFTRVALGSCDGVLDLLDRSESIQGERAEIDRLRKQAEKECSD